MTAGEAYPALFLDGGSIAAFKPRENDSRKLSLGTTVDASQNHVPLGMDAWPAGVRRMWASLQEVPNWLELGPEERVVLSDPTTVFGALPTASIPV
ncbi:hypothetical protein ACE7GA_06350 [Roseomonas sp. CCTCC AB2023176]|uniref:hypothetical protein n=1 Tax=Roseomonas sp. CCTCC AB2023176 TaxID=3342640 RepID=UPI0035DB68FB